MSLQNHIDIVGSVTYGHGYFLGKTLSYHIDYVCFLFWRYTTCEYNVGVVGGSQEFILKCLIMLNGNQRTPRNYNSLFVTASLSP